MVLGLVEGWRGALDLSLWMKGLLRGVLPCQEARPG